MRFAVVALLLALGSTPVAEAADRVPADVLQAIVDDVRAETGVVALAVGVVSPEGLETAAVSGKRRVGSDEPVALSDRWHIASCNKAMTAVLVAQFVERGQLRWGMRVPELFPEFADRIHDRWHDLTLEDLLSHRAGLGDVGVLWWLGARLDFRSPGRQRAATARRLLRNPPALPVGAFSYSNYGYMIVGAALERLDPERRSWEQMMREDLFAHVASGPDGFGFGAPIGRDQPEGHSVNWLGTLRPVGQGTLSDNPASFGPAGTVHATFEAWGSFLATMLVGADGPLVSAESRKHLLEPFPDAGSGYALGWFAAEVPGHGVVRKHPGSNRMWRSLHVLVPDRDFGLLVAANQADDASEQALETVAARVLALITDD